MHKLRRKNPILVTHGHMFTHRMRQKCRRLGGPPHWIGKLPPDPYLVSHQGRIREKEVHGKDGRKEKRRDDKEKSARLLSSPTSISGYTVNEAR